MTTAFERAARVQLLDRLGVVVASVPASIDGEALRLALTPEEARACASMRLLDDEGKVLATLPIAKPPQEPQPCPT